MANVKHSTLTGSDLHEPKGISTASTGDIYIADGAGSGEWAPGKSYIFIYLDTGATTTRSFGAGDLNQDLDFALTYNTGINFNWAYSDTTKVITYSGTDSILCHFGISCSIKRTDTTGTPVLQFFLKKSTDDITYTAIENTRCYTMYSGVDVRCQGIDGLFQVDAGDTFKFGVRVDVASDYDALNIAGYFNQIGVA